MPNDYMVQLLRIQEQIDAGYDSISPEMQAILEAYADGMNFYAALHEDAVYPGLFPMDGRDMVAAAVHKTPLFFGLDGALGELFAEERQNTVSPRPDQTWLPYQPGAPNPYFAGSNTFAVAPSRTSDGSTYLLVNAHQPAERLRAAARGLLRLVELDGGPARLERGHIVASNGRIHEQLVRAIAS